jgi:hypothetical protein
MSTISTAGANSSDDTGADFKEVESAFKANGDEEGLLACANDGIKVYGCGPRQKHEKKNTRSIGHRRKISARRQLLVGMPIESKFARQSGTSGWDWMR